MSVTSKDSQVPVNNALCVTYRVKETITITLWTIGTTNFLVAKDELINPGEDR